MSLKLQSRLYVVYSKGWRWAYALKRRVTLFGWLMICAFPVMCFMALQYPRQSFFQLLALGSALFFVSVAAFFTRRAKLSVTRDLPAYGTAGEPVRYRVRVKNLGRMKLSNYFLSDHAPDPTPSKELFLNSTEPGEELRNGFDRKFIAYRWMWMIQRRLLLKSEDFLAKTVDKGAEVSMSLSFTPIRRGVISLENLYAILPDPLGLFQRLVKVDQVADTLTVLPKRYVFSGLNFEGESRNQLGGDAATSVAGQSGEFVSLREYRAGDPIKHIHWPSWGRTGKPVIKVYEDLFFPRYGLVLDTVVRAEQEEEFETAISLVATFACAVDTEQSLLDLMFLQQAAQIHSIGKNVNKVDSMLEVLASLDMEPHGDWKALAQVVLKHADELTTCIVVLCDWDDQRKVFLEQLVASGVQLCVLLVVSPQSAMRAKGEGYHLQVIATDNVEASLAELSAL